MIHVCEPQARKQASKPAGETYDSSIFDNLVFCFFNRFHVLNPKVQENNANNKILPFYVQGW